MCIEAMQKALEGLEDWSFGKDPREAEDYILDLEQAIEDEKRRVKVSVESFNITTFLKPDWKGKPVIWAEWPSKE